MLPDFPKLKKKFQETINQYSEKALNKHLGFFESIPKYRHYEGQRWVMRLEDGSETQSSYKTASSTFTIHNDEVAELTWNILLQRVDQSMLQMAEQASKELFNSLINDAFLSNNVLEHSSEELDINIILKSLESLAMDFDENGEGIMPTVIVSPEMAEKLKPKLQEWNADPQIDKKFKEIIERKKEEWRARESSRRLVD